MLIDELSREFYRHIDKKYHADSKIYFKGEMRNLGVRVPVVRKISSEFYKKMKGKSKEEILTTCEELMKTRCNEFVTVAQDWAFRQKKKFTPEDFDTFEIWVKSYITNWGTCDDLCTHTMGYFLLQFPQFLPRLNDWAKSENQWERRASAVSLIYPMRKGKYIGKAFEIADILLEDREDLVQKGYGWMLKVAADKWEDEVFGYVLKNRERMPRTSLRYAIEKMPPERRKEAMEK